MSLNLAVDYKKLRLENRIDLLKSRHNRENAKVVSKLQRQLRSLSNSKDKE